MQKVLKNKFIGMLSKTRINMVITMASKGGVSVLGALSAVLIARYGGAEVLGFYALARVVPAIYILATEVGVSNAYPYLINRLGHRSEAVYQSGVFCLLGFSILQLLLWPFISYLLSDALFPGLESSLVLVIGAMAPLQMIYLHAVNLLRSIHRVGDANSVVFAQELLALLAILILVGSLGLTVKSVITSLFASYFLLSTLVILYLWGKGFKFIPVWDKKIISDGLRYGFKTQVGNAFQILNYRIDQLLVASFVGVSSLGVYVIAAKAAEVFRFFSTSIVFVYEPLLSGKPVRQAGDVVKRNYLKMFSLNLVLIALGVLFVPKLIPYVFDEWSAAALLPFYILSLGMLISGSNGLIGAYNFSIGRPEFNTRVISIGFVSTIFSNIYFISRDGMIGAAIASATTQFVVTIAFLLQFYMHRKNIISSENLYD